ncbi:MAG: hypothetical protein ACI8W7_000759 [Gammaproteobacteria bacterium]|jgi:hypothetical protein
MCFPPDRLPTGSRVGHSQCCCGGLHPKAAHVLGYRVGRRVPYGRASIRQGLIRRRASI